MQSYNREIDGPLQKGQVFVRSNPFEPSAMWPGIVMEKEKTKKYSPYNIINCGEIFGFEHECGSLYANEVIGLLSVDEFKSMVSEMGFENEKLYFKGELVGV